MEENKLKVRHEWFLDIELEIEESYEINERALETRRRIMDALAAVEKGPDKSDNKEIGGINVPLVSLESPPISGDENANEALNLDSGSPIKLARELWKRSPQGKAKSTKAKLCIIYRTMVWSEEIEKRLIPYSHQLNMFN